MGWHLLGYAGALRRSELVRVDVEHLRFRTDMLEILLPRSKGDPDGEGQRISAGRGKGRDSGGLRAGALPPSLCQAAVSSAALSYQPALPLTCSRVSGASAAEGNGSAKMRVGIS